MLYHFTLCIFRVDSRSFDWNGIYNGFISFYYWVESFLPIALDSFIILLYHAIFSFVTNLLERFYLDGGQPSVEQASCLLLFFLRLSSRIDSSPIFKSLVELSLWVSCTYHICVLKTAIGRLVIRIMEHD